MGQGMTPRRAALIAGFTMLVTGTVPFAELYVYPKLVVAGDIAATVQNITAHRGLFVAGILAYMNTFIGDVIVAWALYFLLVPVHRPLSLLAAWFRLVYTVIAFVALFKLVTVYRLLATPDYETAFGGDQLRAQVQLLLSSFRYEWSFSMVLFGIHLVLLGYLVYRAGFIPRVLGVLLVVDGLGWLVNGLGPYVLPGVDLGLLRITFFGEILFWLWLLIRGWKIPERMDPGPIPARR